MESKFKNTEISMKEMNEVFLQQRRDNQDFFPEPSKFINMLFRFIFNQVSIGCWVDKKHREYFSEHAEADTTLKVEYRGGKIDQWEAHVPLCPGGWDRLEITMNGHYIQINLHEDGHKDGKTLVKMPIRLLMIMYEAIHGENK